MTWGVQNTEAEAHEQLDYAIKDRGVNFIDTAEMYPVPSSAPGWRPGRTEEYIGTWLAKNPEWRSRVVLATKVSGFNPRSETGGNRFDPPKEHADCRLDAESVKMACDASLRRLQTEYIDLYQLHWPDRYAPNFGSSVYDPSKERDAVPIKETVAALGELIAAGKIKHYGLSNETTYGVCEFVRAADELGVPRPVSIQNSFCLLHRSFETELAEACAPSHYDIALLPWTPPRGRCSHGQVSPRVARRRPTGKVPDIHAEVPERTVSRSDDKIRNHREGRRDEPRDDGVGVVPHAVVRGVHHHWGDDHGAVEGEYRRV